MRASALHRTATATPSATIPNPFFVRRTPAILRRGTLLALSSKRATVLLSELCSSQATLTESLFQKCVAKPPTKLPVVAVIRDVLYIVDGNHRLAARLAAGEKTARVVLTQVA